MKCIITNQGLDASKVSPPPRKLNRKQGSSAKMSSRNLNGGTDGSTSSCSDGSTSNESCSNNNTFTYNIINNIHPFSPGNIFPSNNPFRQQPQLVVQIHSIDESEKKFVRYQMQVTYNGATWYISRRFSEFHSLLEVVSSPCFHVYKLL